MLHRWVYSWPFSFSRAIQFYVSETKKIHVLSGADDGRIYLHNLHAPGAKPTVLQGHMSTITSLALYQDHTLIR